MSLARKDLNRKRFDKIRSEEHEVRRSILDAHSAPRRGEEGTQ